MSVLVTGGAGFIGSHLIERLLGSTSLSIVCLDNFNDYYDPARKRSHISGFADHPRVTIVEQTFCDREAMHRLFDRQDVRRVVHLGAYAGVRRSVEIPHVYQKANVEGTLTLLEAARVHGVDRFLLISSSTVYGRGADAPFREDAPLGVPMSPYGATKRAAELLGLTYHDLHALPVVCLRPFSVYGPRLRPDLAMSIFADAILDGRPLPLFGDGSIRRDFTHVLDICAGLQAALDSPQAVGQTINLGHSTPIEVRELIRLLENALGRSAVIDRQPEKPGDMPITYADLRKAEQLLQYHPRVAFEEGVVEFADWYAAAKRQGLISG